MLTVIVQSGQLLARHWPALAAWYLAGVLGRYLLVQLAGFVGASTALGGMLLLPLAVLARLVSFVAMFLVLRDGMFRLRQLAPLLEDRAGRSRSFVEALLAAILPFFAFYAAWGYLREDVAAYLQRSLRVQEGMQWGSILTGEEVSTAGTGSELGFEPLTIALVVLAFAVRWALQRYQARLPRLTSIVAVYLETVWVFFSVTLVADAIGWLRTWIDSRQAIVWLTQLREWLAAQATPLAWLFDAFEWLLAEAGGLILLPVAWLTIAGVVYGQAIAAAAPRAGGARAARLRQRWGGLPGWVRRRLSDLGGQLVARVRPIFRAFVLMWRAGPVLLAGYVLLYTVLLAASRGAEILLTRLIGPQDYYAFWAVADAVLLLAVPLLLEPLRFSLVASAYDATLAALPSAPPPDPASPGSEDEGEAKEPGQALGHGEVEDEGALGVLGQQEGHDDAVRSGGVREA